MDEPTIGAPAPAGPLPAPAPNFRPKPTPPPAEARARIMSQYGRISTGNRPMVCPPGREGKVIFDTREAAEAAEAALRRDCGSKPQRIYECDRSKHGHLHLTGDLEGKPSR